MFKNILGNIGELAKLKKMQDELKKMRLTHTRGEVEVEVTGEMHVSSLKIAGVAQDEVVKAINEAMSKIQMQSAKQMMGNMG